MEALRSAVGLNLVLDGGFKNWSGGQLKDRKYRKVNIPLLQPAVIDNRLFSGLRESFPIYR